MKKKQQTECESLLTMATEQGPMLSAVLLPIRVLHCPSHQPLEEALCSPKSQSSAGEPVTSESGLEHSLFLYFFPV